MNIFSTLFDICIAIANWFWGLPILFLIGGGGLYISFRLGFIQVRKIKYICSQTFGSMFKKNSDGKISSFGAACSALGACIGASNVVGVPVAIALGGPGAIFWMWIIAIVGCATKYTEIALCLKYRTKNSKGEWTGSSYSYIKELFGGKKLGYCIAITGSFLMMLQILPSLGVQSVSAVSQLSVFHVNSSVVGIILTIVITLIVFGGIKRIAKIMELTVPFMAALYVLGVFAILCMNAQNIIPSFVSIFTYALKPYAAVGGFAGSTVAMTIRWGCARGVYSNEAGFGSAPTAHCTAEVDHPIRQAMWGVFEVIVDTLVICTATALAVLSTGVWKETGYDSGALAQAAFHNSFGVLGDYFVAISVTLFVITTVTMLIFYAERQAEWLFHSTKAAFVIRIVALILMLITTFGMELTAIIQLTDFFSVLFIIPNMLAVILLVSQVAELQKEFFNTPGKYYLADVAEKEARKLQKKKQ